VLVCGVDKLSSITNYEDRNTCVLFGDAAGAVVVGASDDDSGVLGTFMKSDGRMRDLLWIKTGGAAHVLGNNFDFDGSDKILMNGTDVFKIAVREMGNAARHVMEQVGITADDLALVIPHQANIRIIDALVKRLKVDKDKVYLNIHKYGNTSAASVPLALDEANREGRIKPGDYVLMVAFGGGLIWGSALVRW
jgi:3-oxoacyl-[acyl-carrier-protein] synthase-3